MEAKELRIGNEVNFFINGNMYQGAIYCIDYKTCTIGNNIDRYTVKHEYIEPIPLTQEWLERFGFECVWSGTGDGTTYKKGHVQLHGDHWPLHYCGSTDWVYYPKLEHVHQLQNLYFALTGQELELIG